MVFLGFHSDLQARHVSLPEQKRLKYLARVQLSYDRGRAHKKFTLPTLLLLKLDGALSRQRLGFSGAFPLRQRRRYLQIVAQIVAPSLVQDDTTFRQLHRVGPLRDERIYPPWVLGYRDSNRVVVIPDTAGSARAEGSLAPFTSTRVYICLHHDLPYFTLQPSNHS